MALKCGIVGLPNVGKSTLFNALTSAKALAANYPFATKEPNIGVITVPDPRLDKLAELVKPQKVQPTTVDIVDIAGLIKGASKGEGLGNQFLGNIRETDAIIHVVRCFEDDNVVHVDGSVDPVRDKMVIDTELIFKDIETVEKRVEKFRRTAKSGDKESKKMVDVGDALLSHLNSEKPARSFETDEEGQEIVNEMMLLTAKPILYVCNVDEESFATGNAYTQAFQASVAAEKAEVILISAQIEAEIAELESREERLEFLQAMGLSEPGVNKVIRSSYQLLNLLTYFTAGVKEVRAWTIKEGTKAPGAAGVIHTDFEKGFIRAEVIHYEDYVKFGSEAGARDNGKLGVEGKEYVVQDGDVMHFRFNV
ncbi:redox-regulated ATPase YchF [Neolewinella lacunae]|uniref:Ribosome-binding ATPase YchF n=1 Tax=Neolewinella lacunae TaxID=1517758 RepID=A0A923PF03_9BACT|nr:redox-regulated ATPase YchF [Neolewinella lacunae]MBC6992865.1 redox-regulated ATPase YchF [Neolewinella lacunae]MDN3633771.1 redox-regulated ATPase YchF [Neolewinella lacunae]